MVEVRPRITYRLFHQLYTPATNMKPGTMNSDSHMMLEAAAAGEGVALGWEHLINPQIRSGALMPVAGQVLRLASPSMSSGHGRANSTPRRNGSATGYWKKGDGTA